MPAASCVKAMEKTYKMRTWVWWSPLESGELEHQSPTIHYIRWLIFWCRTKRHITKKTLRAAAAIPWQKTIPRKSLQWPQWPLERNGEKRKKTETQSRKKNSNEHLHQPQVVSLDSKDIMLYFRSVPNSTQNSNWHSTLSPRTLSATPTCKPWHQLCLLWEIPPKLKANAI